MQGLRDNKRLLKGGSSLSRPLAKVVLDGVSKPGQRGDAVLALLAAVTLASGDAEVDRSLESEKVWEELSKPTTAFLSTAAMSRLPAEEASCAAALLQELLTNVSPATLVPAEFVSVSLARSLVVTAVIIAHNSSRGAALKMRGLTANSM